MVEASAMPLTRGLLWLPLVAWIGAPPPHARSTAPQRQAPLRQVLASAADYLDDYDRRFSAVVSEEHYAQYVRRTTLTTWRELRSDVLVLNAGEGRWLGFRDVFEVDRRPVRDRTERLASLFVAPTDDALFRAQAIADESARFNLGAVNRNVNLPTFALSFLRRDAQARSRFTSEAREVVGTTPADVIRFEERARPRLIRTTDGAPARGRFWLEVGTGRVVKSELVVDSVSLRATFEVTYAPQPRLDAMWVPVRMKEHYQLTATQTIDGTAEYTNFRRFAVDVATIIK
jgi:hypothetical protein